MQGKQYYLHHRIGSSPDFYEVQDMNDVVLFEAKSPTAFSNTKHELKDSTGTKVMTINWLSLPNKFQLNTQSETCASFNRVFAGESRFEGQGAAGKFILDIDQVGKYVNKLWQPESWKINDGDYNRLAEIQRPELGGPSYLITISDDANMPIVFGIAVALSRYQIYTGSKA